MKRLWIVHEAYEIDPHIYGAFTTEEKANEFIAKYEEEYLEKNEESTAGSLTWTQTTVDPKYKSQFN